MLTKTLGSVFPVLSYNLHDLLLRGVCNLRLKAVSGSNKDKKLYASTGGLPQEGTSPVYSHKAKTYREKFIVFFQPFPLLCKYEKINTL